jgi:hypothetical protein
MIGSVGVLATVLLVRALVSPGTARAQSVEEASATLDKTEQRLATTVGKSNAAARRLDPDHPENLPAELQEFTHTTTQLLDLKEELGRDITEYDRARTEKLAAFAQELSAIKDPTTRRPLERLRSRLHRQTTEQLTTARSVLAELNQVLAQGNDLGHAAACITIAADLENHGNDLNAQAATAKAQASAYARTTSNLLASLTKNTTTAD